ncbi:hypothetical protein YA0089_27930 [Pseudomonas viridiflava]|uniref:hypothetical protein n=1 Tax=Pseudomonas viridiflava TaxID=33069 RepID=UPI0018E605F3|nr:hypothetical protein [Pseudomonas viridiflava]MBI6727451.1 hypothetical protein [Pseudomonas viridiflava]
MTDTSNQAVQATWAQKIRALRLAAQGMTSIDVAHVKLHLDRGTEEIYYKDHAEFNCENDDHYIFGEAEHLIEERNIPFDAALEVVLREDAHAIKDSK